MTPRVNIICMNHKEDRIIPRMARALAERFGWVLTPALDPRAEAVYLSGYFEGQRLRPWPDLPVAAYFSHREEEPPGNSKAKLFDLVASRADLRVVTCKLYGNVVSPFGPTIQAAAPLEWDRFIIRKRDKSPKPVVGFSGYTYANHRKGEDLVRGLIQAMGNTVEWRASGRGWPVPTKRFSWAEMPSYYQGLDVLVIPSRVEGIPMPPLEALACGVKVVIPRGVGLLDELPDVAGIYRYERGHLKGLVAALSQALISKADPESLRAIVTPYSLENWSRDIGLGITKMLADKATDLAGIDEATTMPIKPKMIRAKKPVPRGTNSTRGIYCVAFGEPSRRCASRLIASIRKHMPDIPVAICGAKPLGIEDVFVRQPDSDVGGRRAKLKAYELAPAEWQSVLYLDADTEVVAPIYRFFEWVENGWEFVMCKDPHLMDTMHAFERRNNKQELRQIEQTIKTLHALQINGGVWAFRRCDRVAAFFQRWQLGWEEYAQRDQGALIRALYSDPLRILILGNEWNTFPKYTKGIVTAGLMHYPGDARRWKGMLPGRIDSPEAWAVVKRHERILR